MANSNRRIIDNGKQFVPMNVEGGSWAEHFISTKKLIWIFVIFGVLGLMIFGFIDSQSSLKSILIGLAVWLFISQIIVRYIVFEEKFYYKMYKKMQGKEITDPSVFWDISYIKDTPEGAIVIFSDGKTGVFIELDRDTIVGKDDDFREQHYDSLSDFYRRLFQMKYRLVWCNIMEKTGNDPRIDGLTSLINKSSNKNIRDLMIREVGYIKSITRKSLYESDYLLIYTYDMQKDTLMSDIDECYSILANGAYVGYKVLNYQEIIKFNKDEMGVETFNYNEASVNKVKDFSEKTLNAFTMTSIQCIDGSNFNISKEELVEVNKLASDVLSNKITASKISIKDTLGKLNSKEYKNISLSEISRGYTPASDDDKDTKWSKQSAKHKDVSTDIYSLVDSDISDLDF